MRQPIKKQAVSRLTKTEENRRFLRFSVLHPPPVGRPWWGECLFASFSTLEKVRE